MSYNAYSESRINLRRLNHQATYNALQGRRMTFKTFRLKYLLLIGIQLISTVIQAAENDDHWHARSSSLRDSGLLSPVVLDKSNRDQHFYFPIAQNVKRKDMRFELEATYLRQFVCTDGLTISINGISSKALLLPAGKTSNSDNVADNQTSLEINFSVEIKDVEAAARFVDIGVSFNSQNNDKRCTDVAGHGNEILLHPRSGIQYSYDVNSVSDIRSFLSTLPKNAQILLPNHVSGTQYEAALRLHLGLSNLGLSPKIVRLPNMGDEISVAGLQLPAAMAEKSMFRHIASSLSQQHTLRIEKKEDIASWLALRLMTSEGLADIVIDSSSITEALNNAASIWANEGVLQMMPSWVKQAVTDKWQIKTQSTLANLSLVNWAGTQLLLLDDANLTPAALLTGSFWSTIINGAELGVDHADSLSAEPSSHLMFARNLPAKNLQAETLWDIPFYAKDFPEHKLPNHIQLNISPVKTNINAVISVFINGILITAQKLNTNGDETLVSASVPFYSLKANNVTHIEVTATGIAQPIPLQILPNSYLGLTSANNTNEFFSLIPALTHESTVVIPATFLQHPELTVANVNRVLRGLQMSPSSFILKSVDGEKFSTKGAFVSFDVKPENLHSLVESHLDKLTIRDRNGIVVFDSRGLGNLAIIQLIDGQGILVNRVGRGELNIETPIELSSGNLAVVDRQGVKLVLNTNDPKEILSLNESNRGLKYFFKRYHLPLVIIGGLLGLALAIWATVRAWAKARSRVGLV